MYVLITLPSMVFTAHISEIFSPGKIRSFYEYKVTLKTKSFHICIVMFPVMEYQIRESRSS